MTTSLLPDLLGTAPADLIAADINRPKATQDEARERLAEIKRMVPTFVRALRMISDAYACRDWEALGYGSWAEYRDAEFGELLDRAVTAERREAVAEMRAKGMSVRDIAAVVRASVSTVHDDIARCSGPEHLPQRVTGADGKTYAATRPAVDPPTTAGGSGPAPGDTVWIATARKGIAGHALKSSMLTRCSRATRTGLTLTARQATDRWAAVWCRICWPAEETTRVAAGEAAPTGPRDETPDPRASREAEAECRDSASAGETVAGADLPPADGTDTAIPSADTAPAPAPAPATSAAGAGVTPGLDLTTIARVRAALGHLRAVGGRRTEPHRYELPYASTAEALHRGGGPSRVDLVDVQWYAPTDVCIRWLAGGGRYEPVGGTDFYPATVAQALDVLCALGILPARLSSQYAAGVLDGMRVGTAIDGKLIEENPHG